MGRRDAGTQGRRILCLSVTFCALFGAASARLSIDVGGPYEAEAESHIWGEICSQSAVDGDTLQFKSEVYVFSDHVEIDKNLGLCGAEFSEGGPLTVLEKSESANCRFFYFSGDGGGESGVRFIAFDGNGLYASDSGGAIYCCGSFTGGVHSSIFSGNEVSYDGGAISCYNFTGGVHSSIFSGNEANWNGGAIFCGNFTGGVHSSIFSGNEADYY
ncbi:MAG: hypothetical protein LBH53_02700, partial [Puniceicoccales bacterium]|nr:hypothetical protein [Puniceicoccales bacterium]